MKKYFIHILIALLLISFILIMLFNPLHKNRTDKSFEDLFEGRLVEVETVFNSKNQKVSLKNISRFTNKKFEKYNKNTSKSAKETWKFYDKREEFLFSFTELDNQVYKVKLNEKEYFYQMK